MKLYKSLFSVLAASLLLGACQQIPTRTDANRSVINDALKTAQTERTVAPGKPPKAVQDTLLPPMGSMPGHIRPLVPSYDVSVNEVPAREFFMSLVDGTSDNMVVHPEVSGALTLDLKDVTTDDVLATVRDVYGYEFRHSRGVYQVFPARMRSQVFSVNYLDVKRKGSSRTRISSGQVTQAPPPNNLGTGRGGGLGSTGGSAAGGFANPGTGTGPNSRNRRSFSGAQVSTQTDSDFWDTLEESLKTLIGEEEGRKIIADPLSGTVLVRAMPRELMDVAQYLKSLQASVNRQVIIEAKIIEVQLNDAFQAGINWSSFIDIQGASRELTAGVFGTGLAGPMNNIVNAEQSALSSVSSLDIHLGDFDALLELLKTQGDVQVLSSPRVSTVNNQKALIKVGTDEYFVTDLDTSTDIANSVSSQSADVTLTPFFSGVALDVTPQIDADGNITMHVHPAISEVTEDTKNVSISTTNAFSLPLATSSIRESDTIVRARNGQVIVIGGLMQDIIRDDVSSTPFFGSLPIVGNAFRQTRKVSRKTELVILLRPTIVNDDRTWKAEINRAGARFSSISHPELTW
ncbi:MSHA biogenesis protein MshL [hydrothermal vent metagenome]|uniref:MSHA biogenesis protein MshL n=1 Tax=hydrothermal vent metagenome TaxID=652676 RepID=A0A3B0Z4N9_9ZZZZ